MFSTYSHEKRTPLIYDYKLEGKILKHKTSEKYLGCILTSELDWHEHINSICNKANKTLGFLRRNLHINSYSIKDKAYKALVRPIVEYAPTVWDPYRLMDINNIENVQRRAARYVFNRYRSQSSVTEMLQKLNWKTLAQRRKEARLAMLYKISEHLVSIDNDKYLKPPNRFTRHMHCKTYQVPKFKTDYRKESFFPRTIKDWNNLSSDIVSADTLDIFRAKVANSQE